MSDAPDGLRLDKSTTEEAWKRILTPKQVRWFVHGIGRGGLASRRETVVGGLESGCGEGRAERELSEARVLLRGDTCGPWLAASPPFPPLQPSFNASSVQYSVLRQRGTDPAFTGAYTDLKAEGVYECAACGAPLYGSATKFRSGCGWPSFYQELPGAVDRYEDFSYGMRRVEITCARCGSHLGHVFEGEGFKTPTDLRHCVNSTSLKFKPVV